MIHPLSAFFSLSFRFFRFLLCYLPFSNAPFFIALYVFIVPIMTISFLLLLRLLSSVANGIVYLLFASVCFYVFYLPFHFTHTTFRFFILDLFLVTIFHVLLHMGCVCVCVFLCFLFTFSFYTHNFLLFRGASKPRQTESNGHCIHCERKRSSAG